MCKWETIVEIAERRGNFTADEKEEAQHWYSNPTGDAEIDRDRVYKPVDQRWQKMSIRFMEMVEDEIPDFDEIKKYLTKINIAKNEVSLGVSK